MRRIVKKFFQKSEKKADFVEPLHKEERRKRRRELITSVVIFVAIVFSANFAISLSKASATLPFVNSIFFFGIVNLNVILLAFLVLLIFRNLSKFFFERRRDVLGAKLKSKLVLGFVSLSVIPTVVLFIISSLYINTTFDKWFSVRIGNMLQASLEITNDYYRNSQKSAQHFAEKIREEIIDKYSVIDQDVRGKIEGEFAEYREKYSLDAAEIYWHPLEERHITGSHSLPARTLPRLPIGSIEKVMEGETLSLVQHVGSGDVLRSIIPLYRTKGTKNIVGVLSVNYHIPVSLVNKAEEISSTFEDYQKSNPLKYPIKSIYFSILILITLLVMFAAIWVGLYLARELTDPLAKLESAVKEVGRGNLNVTVENPGKDEIATVSQAFNQMIGDLRENRDRLESTNQELDEKRRYVEAILSNVSAGVCSIAADFCITTINKSAATLLSLNSETILGKNIKEVFSGPLVELYHWILEVVDSRANETLFKYLNLSSEDGQPVSLLTTVTPLYDSESKYLGLVVVLDDITHLIKAQREAAWREVARRIAHEIKNPLTPIKLSAQRIQKRYMHQVDKTDSKVFLECTDTIIKQVDELKQMVNEFSQFARLPAVNPEPNDLNQAVKEVVGLYREAHKKVKFVLKFDEQCPIFSFDRDQIKRVIINLIDNAIAAFSLNEGEITISTGFKEKDKIVSVEVSDNGVGIPNSMMPLLFEPYFSTKKEGTGLGLAIAKRIINDHDGYVKAFSRTDAGNSGTCFRIELPMNRTVEVRHGT